MVFNSIEMSLRLVESKRIKLIAKAKHILPSNRVSIREVASLLGSMTAAFEAVSLGKVNYRNLEYEKIISLIKYQGNFEKT